MSLRRRGTRGNTDRFNPCKPRGFEFAGSLDMKRTTAVLHTDLRKTPCVAGISTANDNHGIDT